MDGVDENGKKQRTVRSISYKHTKRLCYYVYFSQLGFLVFAAGILMIFSLGLDIHRIIKGNKACKDGKFGYSPFDELVQSKSCKHAEFTVMMLLSTVQIFLYVYHGFVIIFFKRKFPYATSFDDIEA